MRLRLSRSNGTGGYKAWVEDENGRNVDEETLKKNDIQRTTRTLYERVLGVLIWGQPQRSPSVVFMRAVYWLVTSSYAAL